jgi:cysteine desulfurase / selenocysteine lyase
MPLPVNSLQSAFIGVDTEYLLADGRRTRRCYLDSAASGLMLRPAWKTAEAFLRHYANTHSDLHFGARIATHAYAWAHERALAFVKADPAKYACAFIGSGATGGINRLARTLRAVRPERKTVLVSGMEHHSNDLPHRKHAEAFEHIPMVGDAPAYGCIDTAALAKILDRHRGDVRYVAVTGASNVTGIINPLPEIADLVHAHDAWLVVDGSQLVMHAPIDMSVGIDFLVFSGHKVYAPGSPGVLVGRRDLLAQVEPDEVGGGIVDDVSLADYLVAQRFPDREEAGTPNIVGAVLLGAALETLLRVGMNALRDHENALMEPLLNWMAKRPGVRVYGDTDLARSPRTGTIAFNLQGWDHALVAAALNDYWGIAVRNACFCAHPYVREMLKPELWALDSEIDTETAAGIAALKLRQGMVRASLGLYTTAEDLDLLKQAIDALLSEPERFKAAYRLDVDGTYTHRQHHPSAESLFDPVLELERQLAAASCE